MAIVAIKGQTIRYRARAFVVGVPPKNRLLSIICWSLFALTVAHSPSMVLANDFLRIIDAHSQIDSRVDIDTIVSVLEQGKVDRVILSSLPRAILQPQQLFDYVSKKHRLIVPAIMAKGSDYDEDAAGWYERLEVQSANPRFKGMGEAHLYHAAKGRAAEVIVMPSDPRINHLLKIAKRRNWPLVLHAELKLAGDNRDRILKELETRMAENPQQAFLLTHMAQLEADEVRALITRHPNVYFITSHSNHLFIRNAEQLGSRHEGPRKAGGSVRQSWIDMFDGNDLKVEWQRLLTTHPDRFVLGFDNVNPSHWSDIYLKQISLWRSALAKLPQPVAEAVAHGNAERLWRLSDHDNLAPATRGVGIPAQAARGEELVGPRGFTAQEVISNNDRNGDKKLAPDEFQGRPQTFRNLDADRDGFITKEEFEARWRAQQAQ